MNFASFFQSLNFSNPTWDLFILVFFVAVALLYGLSMGRDRILVVLVSIYMALAVVANAPFLKTWSANITINEFFAFKVTAFVGIFLVTVFLISRSGLMKTLGASNARGSWWQIIIFSFLHVGLLISTTLSFLPAEAADKLAPLTKIIFLGEVGKFAWIIAPILVMTIVREEKKNG